MLPLNVFYDIINISWQDIRQTDLKTLYLHQRLKSELSLREVLRFFKIIPRYEPPRCNGVCPPSRSHVGSWKEIIHELPTEILEEEFHYIEKRIYAIFEPPDPSRINYCGWLIYIYIKVNLSPHYINKYVDYKNQFPEYTFHSLNWIALSSFIHSLTFPFHTLYFTQLLKYIN